MTSHDQVSVDNGAWLLADISSQSDALDRRLYRFRV